MANFNRRGGFRRIEVRPRDFRAIALLTFVVLATGLPFVNRAYFVDDYYHMTMAKGLLAHPWRPYDFLTDDAGKAVPGWERGHWPRMVNPPLFHYCMAVVMKFWGDQVWKLRTASLLFSWIALVCVYFLGKRFISTPLAAAFLVALTPAYWLTSYSLLIDSGLIAFFLAALLCFVMALERRSTGLALLAGGLMGLTILVKYSGVLIVPVALLWQQLETERRRWLGGWWAYAVCLALQVLWGIWTFAAYGQAHFWATLPRGAHASSVLGALLLAFIFIALIAPARRGARLGALGIALIIVGGLFHAGSLRGWLDGLYLDKLLVVGAFLGGTVVFTWLGAAALARRRPVALVAVVTVMVLLAVGLHSRAGGFTVGQSVLFAGFLGAAVVFLLCGKIYFSETPDASTMFMWAWLVMGLIELVLVMPWTAGRYFLLIVPPAAWLFLRMVDVWNLGFLRPAALGLSCVMGAALAASDVAQADTIKRLAADLRRDHEAIARLAPRPPSHWYYLADTFDGSQPYLEPLGWENVFPYQTFNVGDLFLRSRVRKSSWWTVPHPERFQPVAAYDVRSWLPFRVMDVPNGAGFYASCWGALPYVISNDPLERFELARVVSQ